MNTIYTLARQLFRFAIVWLVDGISLLLTTALLPGIGFEGSRDVLVVATSAAFLLGIVNFLIRPLILLLALPFGFIAIFIIGFFLNALGLWITSSLIEGFYLRTLWDAFLGSLILALFNTILTSFVAVDDDDSFYQNLTERLAKRETFFPSDPTKQGVIMMEIDGLSYHHIRKAIDEGWMPTLREMRDREHYQLSRFDCGLPSQTSACQAGIMFGNNFDIPAFRWYDKDLGRLIVSGRDAPLINSRYAKGSGLMREGSSVNNMMNGDARVSVLTLADLFGAPEEQQRRRTEDFYLIFLNPYFFLRTLVLYFGDVLRELYEATLQQLRRQTPRLNRFAHFYPLIRAATTVLMRDISASLTILGIVRGTPALYVTWPGYDEVAHHSGPWTKDAFHTLRQYDHVIRRVRDAIQHKAPRPYELIVLSDHGQSYGWTFKQRYGKTLHEFIKEILPKGMSVAQNMGGDDGSLSVGAMASEMENVPSRNVAGRLGKRIMSVARRAVNRGMLENERANNPTGQPTNVTVCGSGNLAQVYFDLAPRRLTLAELNAAYPNLLDTLVRHEGIGVVMAYADSDKPIVFGKKGTRDLVTNRITGQDPLSMYGDADLRAAQMKRLAEFPHNGDFTVISTFYPDGTVAAMEELVGNHGGLGGEQTDAFLFHPSDFQVPETKNSADVFGILNARRGLTVDLNARQQAEPRPRGRDAWTFYVFWQGLKQVRQWMRIAVRTLLFDRWAFRQAAFNPYMTAPAILIALVSSLLVAWFARGEFNLLEWMTRFGFWFLTTLFVYGAARLLRGTGDFTATLRATGFAQVGYVIELWVLIEPLSALARIGAFLVTFLATWIAASEAHKLRGARTLLLPLVVLLVAVVSAFGLNLLLSSAEMTFATLVRAWGLLPR